MAEPSLEITEERAQPSAFSQTHKIVIDGQRPLSVSATVLEKERLHHNEKTHWKIKGVGIHEFPFLEISLVRQNNVRFGSFIASCKDAGQAVF